MAVAVVVLNGGGHGGPDLFHKVSHSTFRPYKKLARKSNTMAKDIRGLQLYYKV
jgi:hypothetical protein